MLALVLVLKSYKIAGNLGYRGELRVSFGRTWSKGLGRPKQSSVVSLFASVLF